MAFAFPRADLFRYSAKWWSYLVPPVEHPLVGPAVRRFWAVTGIGAGLLEQQVYLGWGIVALGARRDRSLARAVAPRPRPSVARARAGPRRCRRDGPHMLAFAGADDRGVHVRPAVRAALSPRADVPVVRAVRRRRAVDGGAPGGHRGRVASPRRKLARADRVRRAPGPGGRRVCGCSVGDVARRAPDDRAPLGHATDRPPEGPRLYPAHAGVRVGPVADERARELAGRSDRRLPGAGPSRTLAANGYTHLLVRRDSADRPVVPGASPARRVACCRALRRCGGVRGHGATPRALRGDCGGILAARARCGAIVAMDGRRRVMDDHERQRPADRRHPEP